MEDVKRLCAAKQNELDRACVALDAARRLAARLAADKAMLVAQVRRTLLPPDPVARRCL